MKHVLMKTTLFFSAAFLLTFAGWAQQRPGKGMSANYSRHYNLNTVETIRGEVVDVSYNVSQQNAAMTGVHVTVKTESETIPVHLGPLWYLSEQDSLHQGDVVEVAGSRITFNGDPAIVAATVKRGDTTLQLRDKNGYPVWRGWRRYGMMRNNQQ